ncbi:MAG: hypothetical protein JW967_01640 [Dehalococcoidales bacterium]|nr:hypothetical protein [Dehalococcoidales bacterium]
MKILTSLKRLAIHGKGMVPPKSAGEAGSLPGTRLTCPKTEVEILWCIHAGSLGTCTDPKAHRRCIGPAAGKAVI